MQRVYKLTARPARRVRATRNVIDNAAYIDLSYSLYLGS